MRKWVSCSTRLSRQKPRPKAQRQRRKRGSRALSFRFGSAQLTLKGMSRNWPNLFAIHALDGERWVAIFRAPFGRGFDRLELFRANACMLATKPASLLFKITGRGGPAGAPFVSDSETHSAGLPSGPGVMVTIIVGSGMEGPPIRTSAHSVRKLSQIRAEPPSEVGREKVG